jgi:hypothetical protein
MSIGNPDLHNGGAIPASNNGAFITLNTTVSMATQPPFGLGAENPGTDGVNNTELTTGKVAVNL